MDLNVRELSHEEADFHNGVRRKAGSIIETLRREKAAPTLTEEKKEKAIKAFMKIRTFAELKDKFKAIMSGLFKPEYAEIVAEQMKQSVKEMKGKP